MNTIKNLYVYYGTPPPIYRQTCEFYDCPPSLLLINQFPFFNIKRAAAKITQYVLTIKFQHWEQRIRIIGKDTPSGDFLKSLIAYIERIGDRHTDLGSFKRNVIDGLQIFGFELYAK